MAWRERTRVTVHYREAAQERRSVNAVCPWSNKPVSADGMTEFEGMTVGFCGKGHREKFERALAALKKRPGAPGKALNPACPWSGRPAARDAVVTLPTGSVAFCSTTHKERFLHAVKYLREIIRYLDTADPSGHHQAPQRPGKPGQLQQAEHRMGEQHKKPRPKAPSINQNCPWTGKPVSPVALTRFEGHLVGFSTPELRDQFERAATIAGAGSAAGAGSDHGGTGHAGGGHATEAHEGRCNEGGHAGSDGKDAGAPANATCPWSGRPVSPSAVVKLRDGSVGFCGAGHRDEFVRAVNFFRDCAKAGPEGGKCARLVRLVMHGC